MMITDNQAQRLVRSAALSAALLLMAAPIALADSQGYGSTDFRPIANTDVAPASGNAPKPDACYLSSTHAFDARESAPQTARRTNP
jgi:hypothetical protein